MARADIINVLYSKDKSPLEFKFDSLWIPSIYNYISMYEIQKLYNIITSVKYGSKIEEKYKLIHEIMTSINFYKVGSGTNRVVYAHYENPIFVAKIAVDTVGLNDNWAEFKNQALLKPFVTKMFEVSNCGTIGFAERVDPILNQLEFASMAGDIFDLLVKFIIGRFVVADVGSAYFMNWGIRKGFGPCLLDYPYVFELDGKKMYCTRPITPGTKFPLCEGNIDYDTGFNNLICTTCGKEFYARDLSKKGKDKLNIILKGDHDMKVRIVDGNGKIIADPNKGSRTILPPRQKAIETYSQYRGDQLPKARLSGTTNPVISQEVAKFLQPQVQSGDINKEVPITIKVTPKTIVEEENINVDITVPKLRVTTTILEEGFNNEVMYEPVKELTNKEEPKQNKVEELTNEEESKQNKAEEFVNSLTLKNEDLIDKATEERKKMFLIYHHLEEMMQQFPFDKYEKADNLQKEDIKNFLVVETKKYFTKNKIKWTKILVDKIADDFIEKNYIFDDGDEESDILTTSMNEIAKEYENDLSKFGLSDDDFEDPSYEKFPKKKSSKLDDY